MAVDRATARRLRAGDDVGDRVVEDIQADNDHDYRCNPFAGRLQGANATCVGSRVDCEPEPQAYHQEKCDGDHQVDVRVAIRQQRREYQHGINAVRQHRQSYPAHRGARDCRRQNGFCLTAASAPFIGQHFHAQRDWYCTQVAKVFGWENVTDEPDYCG